jgi:hypothetical protein
MAIYESLTIKVETFGCTNPDSLNYDANAQLDDGTCVDTAFTECIKNAVYNVSLKDCDLDNNKRALEIYTYYQSLKAAMKTKNNVKINMYKEKLAKLCNAEYCESC